MNVYFRYPPRHEVDALARTLLLKPDSGFTDTGIRIAKRAILKDRAPERLLTRALAALREGDLDGVSRFVNESAEGAKEKDTLDDYQLSTLETIQGLALLKQKQNDKARTILTRANTRLAKARQLSHGRDDRWWEFMVFQVLLREGDAILRGVNKP